jgi:hypothetical protein
MVDNLSNIISENDIQLLLSEKYSEMSIFEKCKLKELGDYYYYETNENDEIYYLNIHFLYDLGIFFNKRKKIIYKSKYSHIYYQTLINELPNILSIINSFTDNDFNNSIFIDNTIISISKWFLTFGHYQDEAFCLSDFQNQILNKFKSNIKVLLDYHTDSDIITLCKPTPSYGMLEQILFDGNSVNAYNYKKQLLRMNKLYLITHDYNEKTFHSFPIYSKNKILNHIPNTNMYVPNVYISRGKANHLPRNLNNEEEISNYLFNSGYIVCNPELISLCDFINTIRNSDNIIITWGGALTNMIYFKKNANVTILKSKSYDHESIDLFNKIIQSNQLNINIITHVDNNIIIPFL